MVTVLIRSKESIYQSFKIFLLKIVESKSLEE